VSLGNYFLSEVGLRTAYIVDFMVDSDSAKIIQAQVCEDLTVYNSSRDDKYESQLIDFLINTFLLERSSSFPLPDNQFEESNAIFQHAISGTGQYSHVANKKSGEE